MEEMGFSGRLLNIKTNTNLTIMYKEIWSVDAPAPHVCCLMHRERLDSRLLSVAYSGLSYLQEALSDLMGFFPTLYTSCLIYSSLCPVTSWTTMDNRGWLLWAEWVQRRNPWQVLSSSRFMHGSHFSISFLSLVLSFIWLTGACIDAQINNKS